MKDSQDNIIKVYPRHYYEYCMKQVKYSIQLGAFDQHFLKFIYVIFD